MVLYSTKHCYFPYNYGIYCVINIALLCISLLDFTTSLTIASSHSVQLTSLTTAVHSYGTKRLLVQYSLSVHCTHVHTVNNKKKSGVQYLSYFHQIKSDNH